MNKLRWAVVASTLATLAFGAGCSDDGDNDNPNPGSNVIGGSKGDGGSGNKAGSGGKAGSTGDGGNDPGTAGSDPIGGAAPVAGAGGEDGDPPVEECTLPLTGEDGCFNCPETDLQYLNRCSDGDCVPFDNSRLTKLSSDGSLPDLD